MEASKILFLAANPLGSSPLSLGEEAREIGTSLMASAFREALQLKTRWAVRPDDLLQALNEDRPSVVHFSGHGAGSLGIVLHDESGQPKVVKTAALKRLFTAVKGEIRIVVLNACYDARQANAIAEEIDCVIGMSEGIGDDAARRFSASFYRALGFGNSVKNAFDQGIAAICLDGLDGESIPQLLTRPGVDAAALTLVSAAPETPS